MQPERTVAETKFDSVYSGDDAEELVVIVMTRRQWWHIDDWRAEIADRYPNRAAERKGAWDAIDHAIPMKEWLKGVTKRRLRKQAG